MLLSYLATVLSSYRRHLLWVTAGQKRADAHYRALTEYEVDECDVLDSLITQGVEIDLDDGVLVSRLRFGHALQMVASLERKCTDATTRLTRSLTLEKS
ncbi:Uncharacterised protein [Actinomyces bovis]|uniref:Uncharacterized protein n=1 Tax=Actinomyces bovis TaxID=1658 RepID=A0ABY1VL52_9ACTO|nr:hypothetical protein [Actinomyces bovis]SPT52834.1 Uncharacterised protein [Actinomyces bovis]VEG54906.1 Uncharacterised protein [Actinomyces israelii]